MQNIIVGARRSLTGIHHGRGRLAHRPLIARQIHTQHTQSTTPTPQTSRTGIVTALVVVGLAGAYGLQKTFQPDESGKQSLNNLTFTPFKVLEKQKVSSTCSIFTLEQTSLYSNIVQEMWNKGVWSIEIKQPQLQIARSYTPLPPLDPSSPDNQLRLLVRKEVKGEMSNYIHRTPENGSLELRGPAVECNLPSKVDRVVFLAGGTGIAPALQIAHTLQHETQMSILWANRKREDCEGGKSDNYNSSGGWWQSIVHRLTWGSPQKISEAIDKRVSTSSNMIVRQLDTMKKMESNASLTVDYFVDDEGSIIQPKHVDSLLSSSLQTLKSTPDEAGDKIIFVSGPEGFLNYWAGPKEWRNGKEVQGPLGGALSRMNLQGWKVVKL